MNGQAWSGSTVLANKLARCFAHFLRRSVGDIDSIDDADDRSFDRHLLVSDRRSRSFAVRAYHHLTSARAESIRDNNDIACRLLVEIVRMNNEKSDALEIGSLLGRPDCAYNFT